MTFNPPPFPILRVNTINIDVKLSTLLGRYNKLTDNASPAQSPLEILLARTNKVIDCKGTGRITARDVFKQLSIELREVLNENNEIKNSQATFFLLGALLHRYFRIIKEYETSLSSWFVTLHPKSCNLFKAIRGALKLPPEMPDDYRIKDLEVLDVNTIVTALEVFRDNMLFVKNGESQPRYMNYPHFKTDKNFEYYLNAMIEEHSRRGRSAIRQFKGLNFIQSLAKQVEAEHKKIEDSLALWIKELHRTHPDFSQLNSKLIENHLETYMKEGPQREQIADLIYTGFIQSRLPTLNHLSFLHEMKKANLDKASHIVFGGYALLLQAKGVNENLKFCIYEALGIEENEENLMTKDKLNGIKFLEIFVDNNPQVELNCDYFGGKSGLHTQISQNKLSLSKLVKDPMSPKIAAASLSI